MTTALVAMLAAGAVATIAGWLLIRRSNRVHSSGSQPAPSTHPDHLDIVDLGLSGSGPTVVHFSAPWCRPCDRVRHVVHQVCGDLGNVAHVEIDLDANPQAARRFSVLSLPTTLIFDRQGRQRYRSSRIPRPVELRSALKPLLA